MTYLLTLVTPPKFLTQSFVDKILSSYSSLHYEWLSYQEAIDLIPMASLHKNDAFHLFTDLKKTLNTERVDLFLTSSYQRKKKLFIADMDSTIVQSETLDDLANEVGIGEQIASITKRAMNGQLEFAEALKERIALLNNISTELLEKTWQKIYLNDGAKTLLATMKNNSTYTVLVSGGFTFFTERVAKICGFDENHANRFDIQEGRLTGKVIPPILGKEAKLMHLQRLVNTLNLSTDETMAIGDGANDLSMLSYAGIGIGFRPKPIVAQQILNKIQHTSLLSALFIQGYKRSQFI